MFAVVVEGDEPAVGTSGAADHVVQVRARQPHVVMLGSPVAGPGADPEDSGIVQLAGRYWLVGRIRLDARRTLWDKLAQRTGQRQHGQSDALLCLAAYAAWGEAFIAELAGDTGMATILITHDLGLAVEYCQRIVVMHAGHIVEDAPTAALMTGAQHPYSAKLIAATPAASVGLDALASIPGNLPDLRRADLPPCRYSQRCERRTSACDQPLPRRDLGNGHAVACWNPL